MIDRLGTKLGYALAIVFWSIAAMAHAFGPSYSGPLIPSLALDAKTGFTFVTLGGAVAGFSLARFGLGLGEAGNFPASIKAVAEWFPKRERALATGVFNSGTNVGALVAPLVVPWVTINWGWRWAFLITGALGFLWLALWWWVYQHPRDQPRLSREELAYIESDPIEPTTSVPWLQLLRHRQTWAFAVGKFMTDPVWWLYLYWVPDFLHRTHGINLQASALPIFVIYQIATIGSVAGGWLPARLLARGLVAQRGAQDRDARAGRCACCRSCSRQAPPNLWVAVAADWYRGFGASGVVGQHLHVLIGYVSEARGRIRRRDRRHGGGHWRHADRAGRRTDPAAHRELRRRCS